LAAAELPGLRSVAGLELPGLELARLPGLELARIELARLGSTGRELARRELAGLGPAAILRRTVRGDTRQGAGPRSAGLAALVWLVFRNTCVR
jgi:hypothetical protein